MNMRTNKRAILTLTLSLLALLCFAQGNPVKFKASKKQVSDTEVQVMFTMSISKGWHVYSTPVSPRMVRSLRPYTQIRPRV